MNSPKRLVAIARSGRSWLPEAGRGSPCQKQMLNCARNEHPMRHFIVYTTEGRRFAIPLAYHNSPLFQELFKMSEDEYGLPSDGPITIPCDAAFMQYVASSLQKAMPKDVVRTLLLSMATGRCSILAYRLQPQTNPLMLVHGF